MKQPLAWLSWLAVILVILTSTRNPLYLSLIFLCAVLVGLSLRQAGAELPLPVSVWKLAGWIIGLATLFNSLTSHYGSTILFIIPGKLPLISGPITLEAMVYGATNGLVLTGMLASFSVLNMALPARDLINLIPRTFFPVAVVTSIAVTYLPTTIRQFKQIREAQAVRGHQLRSVRDWLPLLMPLLVGGLERAMLLAEAMTARGFAGVKPMNEKQQVYPRLGMILGLMMVVSGWIFRLSSGSYLGIASILTGCMFILGALWFIGRQSPRTSYHRWSWTWRDWLTLISALTVLAVFVLPVKGIGTQALYYEPYPALSLPPFNPLLGLILLFLLAPGILIAHRKPTNQVKRDTLKESA